ncbi:hypothetical protein [Aliiglaciecola sp. M165]|uniref:hypothetical protein n=1 Tax=Aliiglaciecola sp. M165 TaxID=2593649 RepID=UPI00117E8AEE|nr:hypothetical protein [Aliiglaciecola sp. M165]TRY31542.1 hypothetical protein FM019_11785 [Aliiglaciecola sp. M165]
MNQFWKCGVAVLLCTWLCLIAESTSTNQSPSDATFVSSTTAYSNAFSLDDSLAVTSTASNASHFQHYKQQPDWRLVDVISTLFSVLHSDAHLITEPLPVKWFVNHPVARIRISGWKDTGLQFRIINAYL